MIVKLSMYVYLRVRMASMSDDCNDAGESRFAT